VIWCIPVVYPFLPALTARPSILAMCGRNI